MDLDSLRAFCLAFPRATEKLQWGDELCFKVGGKIFTMVGLASVPQRVTFKCGSEDFAELTEREGIAPAAYVGRYKWVTLESLDALTDLELRDSIVKSYEMVAAKAKPARTRPSGRRRKTRAA
jgi:predicted DNA-binding protein (MmcQ/YjbR family)